MSNNNELEKHAKTENQLIQEKAKVWNAHNYKEAERLGQLKYVPLEVAEDAWRIVKLKDLVMQRAEDRAHFYEIQIHTLREGLDRLSEEIHDFIMANFNPKETGWAWKVNPLIWAWFDKTTEETNKK
jgi:hypothetical protein